MKKKSIIGCAIAATIIFLLVFLYQKNRLITLQYERQELERRLAELNEQQRELRQTFVQVSNADHVIRQAHKLGFESINLKQVRKLSV